jgi:hypothetical protein
MIQLTEEEARDFLYAAGIEDEAAIDYNMCRLRQNERIRKSAVEEAEERWQEFLSDDRDASPNDDRKKLFTICELYHAAIQELKAKMMDPFIGLKRSCMKAWF